MPSFPGAHQILLTDAQRPSFHTRACSRPPAPITRIFIVVFRFAENQEPYGGGSLSVNGELAAAQPRACSCAPKMFSSSFMHWDFALILIFFATVVPLLGRRRVRRLMRETETTRKERFTLYASTIGFQWLATAIILWRTHAHGISFAELGFTIPNPALVLSVAVALSALVYANQIFSLRHLAAVPAESQGMLFHLAHKVFPQDASERWAFSALVFTVSICEEVVYRGFAQYVFSVWPVAAAWAGIFGSALLFSLAHLYQGRRGLISTFVVGTIFAGIRFATGSLLAAMPAHFVADLTAGFLAPGRLRQVPAAGAQSSAV